MAVANRESARVRTLLAASATAALVGIALAAAGEENLGGWLTLLSVISLIWGVHKLGRLGPDDVLARHGPAEPGAASDQPAPDSAGFRSRCAARCRPCPPPAAASLAPRARSFAR